MSRTARTTALACLRLCTLGCKEQASEQTAAPTDQPARTVETPTVSPTFYPTEYFPSRIGGDHVLVTLPLPPDADPIFWQPSREQIAAYQEADLIVINGADFEKWIATASLPESRIVDTAAAFEDDFVTYETTTHAHGPGGHEH